MFKLSSFFRLNLDLFWGRLFGILTAVVACLVGLILFFLVRESLPVFHELSWKDVFSKSEWYPMSGHFGMAGMVFATVAVAWGALLAATPFGIGCAVFMVFLAPRSLMIAMKMILAIGAGIPSVVFGLWGLTVLVPWIAEHQPPGASLLASIFILGLMILPTVALTSYSALLSLPSSLRQASLALGIGIKGHVLSVALPAAKNGLVAGMILALARAAGETMAVLMVSGNIAAFPSSIFDPVRTLTANIALEMSYATGQHRAALFASGLLLAICVLVMVVFAHFFQRHRIHE
ncbi:MAG: hypothetical protein RIR26_981 [Pseudomonadota bacterium]